MYSLTTVPRHTASAGGKASQPETLEQAEAQMEVAKTVCRGGASHTPHHLA